MWRGRIYRSKQKEEGKNRIVTQREEIKKKNKHNENTNTQIIQDKANTKLAEKRIGSNSEVLQKQKQTTTHKEFTQSRIY